MHTIWEITQETMWYPPNSNPYYGLDHIMPKRSNSKHCNILQVNAPINKLLVLLSILTQRHHFRSTGKIWQRFNKCNQFIQPKESNKDSHLDQIENNQRLSPTSRQSFFLWVIAPQFSQAPFLYFIAVVYEKKNCLILSVKQR